MQHLGAFQKDVEETRTCEHQENKGEASSSACCSGRTTPFSYTVMGVGWVFLLHPLRVYTPLCI